MTLKEFIDARLQEQGKTWSDLIDESGISNVAAQQMQQGTWKRHSGTLGKLTSYLKCTAGEIMDCMRIQPDAPLSKEAAKPEGQLPKCKVKKQEDTPCRELTENAEQNTENAEQDTVNHPGGLTESAVVS